MALVTVPLSIFTFYVIIRVTPRKMENMKIPMLIAHVWSTNLDLCFTVYAAPFTFFPGAAGLPLGVFSALGIPSKWSAYLGQVAIAIMSVNFVMLLENRHSQISLITFQIPNQRVRTVFFAINYVLAFLYILPFYLENDDQLELRKALLKRIPCPSIEFYDKHTIVLLKGEEWSVLITMTGGLIITVGQALFFSGHTVYHLNYVKNANVSEATKALQKKFLSYIVMQMTIPLIALAGPICYSMYADKYDFYNQADFMMTTYHLMALVTVPLSIFTFYVIIRVTPRKMENMKIPMLIAHVWSTNLDLCFTVYAAPFAFFPGASGLPLGILAVLEMPSKWIVYLGQVSIVIMAINFIMLLENRHSQISMITFQIPNRRVRTVYFFINYVLAFLYILPFYLENDDQLELRKALLKRIPCPSIEFYDKHTIVLLKGGELSVVITMTGGLIIVVGQALFFSGHTVYHLNYVKNANVSEATKALQRKFLSYITMQSDPNSSTGSTEFVKMASNIFWSDYVESSCRQNYSYYHSADFMITVYHFMALFTIPLSIFTFYVIIRVTPRRMENMKIPMLIAHVWSTNLDLCFTVYAAPYTFFPGASGIPLVIGQALFFSGHSVYHLNYAKNANVSEATKALQRKFLGYVITQMTIPWTVLVCPILYSLYAYKYDYYNQVFNNVSMIIMSMHGLSTSCILYIIKPYREFVLSIIKRNYDFDAAEMWSETPQQPSPNQIGSISN
uniref:Serpentine Receptor, class H n=2 Tax=Caenorhabditis tropicalis TaxID=1561998 RepID=A0A1I7UBG5_9PELO